jgi:tellurium resistance protein TerZ
MGLTLEKGQKISLAKADGHEALTKIHMGLGWDAAKPGLLGRMVGAGAANIDLDASCIMFDSNKKMIDAVWFRQLKSKDGSIVHSGDNLTGDGDGDDEVITVDLTRVPQTVQQLVFTVNSFRGQTFKSVDNAFCRLADSTKNISDDIALYKLSGGNDCTGYIMAKVYRHNNEWKMAAIGEPAHGQTFNDMMPAIIAVL